MGYQGIAVNLIGNATHDAEIKTAKESGNQDGDFRLAVKNRQSETTYFPVRCFGKLAEGMANIKKGAKLFVTGDLELSTFTNEEGKKQVSFRVLADTYRILDSGRRSEVGKASGEQPSKISKWISIVLFYIVTHVIKGFHLRPTLPLVGLIDIVTSTGRLQRSGLHTSVQREKRISPVDCLALFSTHVLRSPFTNGGSENIYPHRLSFYSRWIRVSAYPHSYISVSSKTNSFLLRFQIRFHNRGF
jgi:single-strand DNA-binding protein